MTSKFDTAVSKILGERTAPQDVAFYKPWTWSHWTDAVPGSPKALKYAGYGADAAGTVASAFLPVPGARVRAVDKVGRLMTFLQKADKAGDTAKVAKLQKQIQKVKTGSDKLGGIPIGPNVLSSPKNLTHLTKQGKLGDALTIGAKANLAKDTAVAAAGVPELTKGVYDLGKELKDGYFYGTKTNVPDMRNINPGLPGK